MPVDRPGITASQLARTYVASLNEFADEVVAVLKLHADPSIVANLSAEHREICAAVSAAMLSALDASALSEPERTALDPLLREALLPYWEKAAHADPGATKYIEERTAHYLANRSRTSQVKTAVTIVASLLEALNVPRPKHLVPVLTPAFAHRMVTDLYRLNDASNRVGIQLSVFTAAGALLVGLATGFETVLRLLRLT